MKRSLILVISLAVLYCNLYGQMDYLKEVHKNLTFGEPANHRETWLIKDGKINRKILGILLNNHELPPLSLKAQETLISNFRQGRGFIKCVLGDRFRKIDSIIVVQDGKETYKAKSDWLALEDILGEEYSDYLVRREYSNVNLTPNYVDGSTGMDQQIFLSLTNCDVKVFAAKEQNNYQKLVVSLFGELGNESINLPLWSRGSLITGVRFRDYCVASGIYEEFNSWSVWGGLEFPVDWTVPRGSILDHMFKEQRLVSSGTALFVRAKVHLPEQRNSNGAKKSELGLEGSFTIDDREKGDFKSTIPSEFSTIRNYCSANVKTREVWGPLDVGLRISWHDLSTPTLDDLNGGKIDYSRGRVRNWILAPEISISGSEDPIQYTLTAQVNLNLSYGYKYILLKSVFMISNVFGIDFRYLRATSPGKYPQWQYGDYIVFSPIIRISY